MKPTLFINSSFYIPKDVRDQQYKRWLKRSLPYIRKFINENIVIEHKVTPPLIGSNKRSIATEISFKKFQESKITATINRELIDRVANAKEVDTSDLFFWYDAYGNRPTFNL